MYPTEEKSFTQMLHEAGQNPAVILGFVLLIIGRVINFFATFNFTTINFVSIVLNVTIISLFVYAITTFLESCKKGDRINTQKALKAATGIVILTIVLLAITGITFILAPFHLVFDGFIPVLLNMAGLAIFIPLIFFYYRPILNMIKSTQSNIESNIIGSIEGSNTFVIMSFVFVGISILILMLSLAMPDVRDILSTGNIIVSIIVGVMSAVSHVIITLQIKKFANNISDIRRKRAGF
ncbi:MAG: hypothetical protein FWC69_00900 [Defluviitaleaceae bacterium]|nr:hypothetical protein [Defluviitaleaceae bacterium]